MSEFESLEKNLRYYIKRDEKILAEKGKDMPEAKRNYLIQGISSTKAILDALENNRVQR